MSAVPEPEAAPDAAAAGATADGEGHRRLAVGLIGTGRIARTGHLPAYAAADVPVAAICGRTSAGAERLAAQWSGPGRPRLYTSAVELAADPAVELIDVATRPTGRLELIRALLPAGKPLLVQKPLAYTLAEAELIVAEAEGAGVPLAVNHNLRWSPPQRLLTQWLDDGLLGDLVHLAHVHHFSEDLTAWYTDHPGYLFLDHGLHYLDMVRWYARRPVLEVTARAAFTPGQRARCPLSYTIMLKFDGPLVASLTLHNATCSQGAWASNLWVNGTRGDAHLTYDSAGLMLPDHEPAVVQPPGEWVPDGIAGAYTAFVDALARGTRPPHEGRDHLRSLALAEAAWESSRHDGAWMPVPAVTGSSVAAATLASADAAHVPAISSAVGTTPKGRL
ncbi:Gfo/Idh/MocA family oxidoreductase [Sphaerisporangium sp. NPDC051011]|uniref:Gfo/Idh/MocA family protein n=1 Tax=Sphaerisporangium sp. NPDC051011 TaxID=3155792 RepID=UPI0033DEF142